MQMDSYFLGRSHPWTERADEEQLRWPRQPLECARDSPWNARRVTTSAYVEWAEPRRSSCQPQDVRLADIPLPEEELEDEYFHDAMEDICPLLPMHPGYAMPSTSQIPEISTIHLMQYDAAPAAARVKKVVYKAREIVDQETSPDTCLDSPGQGHLFDAPSPLQSRSISYPLIDQTSDRPITLENIRSFWWYPSKLSPIKNNYQ